jgi:hypothetical protein
MLMAVDAYYASVFSDATGRIVGRAAGVSGVEANWSGFQMLIIYNDVWNGMG